MSPAKRKKTAARQIHCADCETPGRTRPHWAEIGGTLVVVVAAYILLKNFGILSLSPSTEGALSLGTIFLVGVAASMSSCLALVGGMLLSVSAKWCVAHQKDSAWHKLEPLLLFNAGRLLGYFGLGGVIGWLGTSFGLSTGSTGVITIALALVMLWLGLNILNILPKKYCSLPMPKSMRTRIAAMSESRNPVAPVLLGALTFLVPCGFTQSMQLLALGSGSFTAGAVIMFVFALGTLPALLGISIVSALANGKFGRMFFRFSGALVLLLAFLNLQSGLALAGFNVDKWANLKYLTAGAASVDPYVTIDDNGQQIVTVNVSDSGYAPNTFSIKPGVSTWIYAVADKPLSGCTSELTIPSLGIKTDVKKGGNWLGPVTNPTKDFTLACSMGMYRAQVYVQQ